MISIKGLHKYFNRSRSNEIHVINDVTLDLPERGMVAIFGKSGCGKTTLLNVIGGLDKYAEGSVTVAGESMTAGSDDLRNRHIGYIFQNYNLSQSQTCYENVENALILAGLKDKAEIAARTKAALRGVGMEKYEKRTPDTLSGGQQQRIAIARAIAKGPSIILADEPTGNLDEANTLMIMELLRDIADERLVIIVTHEERLVDRYCDKVIELSDGKVISVRENSAVGAVAEKSKNDIYLGDLESHGAISDSGAHVEFYGTAPAEPIRVKIVNTGGRIYLKVESDHVQIIDSGSEIRLHNGSYEECVRETTREHVHALPPINDQQRGKCGRLFSPSQALKSGYYESFGSQAAQRRGKKALRRCLMLFAVVAVFISAVFGTSIGDLKDADGAYNHNAFYVYTPNGEVSDALVGAINDPDSGIDYVRLCESIYGIGNVKRLYLKTASFETFDQTFDFTSDFSASCEIFGISLAAQKQVLAGERDGISDRGLVITSAIADELLENSTLGYIDEYKDLIGLYADGIEVEGRVMRVEGVVEGSEKAVYMSELQLAKYVLLGISKESIGLASSNGITQQSGECTVAIRNASGEYSAAVGDTVKLHGKTFTVSDVKTYYVGYKDYLTATGASVETDISVWAKGIVDAEYPNLSEQEAMDMLTTVIETRYYEYLDHYFAYLDGFMRANSFFGYDSIESWMYLERGVDIVKYLYAPEEYYGAKLYYEEYGYYPTQLVCLEYMKQRGINVYEDVSEYTWLYENEFYSYDSATVFYGTRYLVSDADYVELSQRIGETHPEASVTDYKGDEYAHYTLVHSYDPALTEAWLYDSFGYLEAPYEWYIGAIITPNLIYEGIIDDSTDSIVAGVVAMAVMLVLMCICMYFIMRSSLLTRVKEIGVYRAIGVSRGNLISRSLVESAVLMSLTVLVGYIATGIFIRVASSMSTLVADAFYYPLPMALAVLAVLVVTSVTCGTLPTVALVAKTPSEILAKYDI